MLQTLGPDGKQVLVFPRRAGEELVDGSAHVVQMFLAKLPSKSPDRAQIHFLDSLGAALELYVADESTDAQNVLWTSVEGGGGASDADCSLIPQAETRPIHGIAVSHVVSLVHDENGPTAVEQGGGVGITETGGSGSKVEALTRTSGEVPIAVAGESLKAVKVSGVQDTELTETAQSRYGAAGHLPG
jgi:hypothetical protein